MNTEDLIITIKLDDQASTKLDDLKSKISEIESLTKSRGFQHLKDVSDSLARFAQSASNLNNAAGNLKNISEAVKNISHNAKSMSGATKAIDSLGNAIGKISQNGVVASNFTMNFPKASSGVSDMTKLSGITRSLADDFKRAVTAGKALASIPFKMMFEPIKKVASGVASLTNGFNGLFAKIGRVALMRGIRGAIRMVTEAIKKGVGAVYEWAGAVGNSFVGTMNRISTSLAYFRNSIGAAISPILDAIAPVLDAIIDKCVAVINVFNQLIATLTGASTWRKAEKVATSFGGATNKAAKGANGANKAAKELKRTLLGFDEINRLDAPNNGGGSGGGGGGGGGGASGAGALAFTEQPFSDAVENFADMLRKAWDKGDFTEVGDFIGQKIGGALLRVPWEEKIQPTVVKIATSFGTLLNGVFSYTGSGGKKMWDGIAYTVYNALNTAMLGYATFFNTVNWNGIGQGVGAALKKALTDGINWDLVAQSLSAFPNAVIDAIDGFCSQFKMSDFTNAGRSIGGAVAGAIINIKWGTLFSDGVRIAQGILRAINGALESFGERWGEIKTGIANGIKKIPAARWEDLGKQIGRLIVNVAKFIGNVVDAIVQAFESAKWGELLDGIKKGIEDNIDWGDAAKKVGGWVVDHLGTISLLLSFVIAKNMILKGAAGVISGILARLAGTTLGTGAAGAAGAGSASFLSLIGTGLQLTIPLALLWVVSDVEADTKTLQSKEANDILKQMYPNPADGWSQWKGSKTKNGFNTSKSGMGSDGYSLDRYKAAHGIGSYADSKKKGNQTNSRLMGKQDAGPFLKTPSASPVITPKIETSLAGLGSITLDATANITSATDNIKTSDKNTKNWTAIYDYFKGKGVTGSKISNFTAEYTKKIGSAIKAFILKGNTAQYDKKTGSGVTKFTLGKNTAKFDYKNIAFKIGSISGFIAEIVKKKVEFKNPLEWLISGFTAVATKFLNKTGKGATGGIYKNGRWQPVQRYASGGLIGTSGQMFIAREAGPELVGTIGGDTAIMNNDQIVASVSAGVARAVAGVLGGQGDTPIEVIVKLDSEVLYRAMKKGERKASGRYGTVVAIG